MRLAKVSKKRQFEDCLFAAIELSKQSSIVRDTRSAENVSEYITKIANQLYKELIKKR